ncbi:hypothetical protein RSal33209_3377 [Renibacterium salmoninarum ATCC 33209]|uniref:Uncharacterized protein n=1 Tax=Renibacterium salmoninarum (strain ATCC 33209 / DSM 20767 / JCM 11484 / NBRC 15589 / NCIMB 2235) TaxID=288705 RepID=A9WV66_RENSM|nr:hypothetical protein RSal33209_3377 [Renibacterium salmoninarum ATCC 33209]
MASGTDIRLPGSSEVLPSPSYRSLPENHDALSGNYLVLTDQIGPL